MNREQFSELLPNVQAKLLLTKGDYITRMEQEDQKMALYALGKRLYQMTFNNYSYDKIIDINEISPENAMNIYFFNNA